MCEICKICGGGGVDEHLWRPRRKATESLGRRWLFQIAITLIVAMLGTSAAQAQGGWQCECPADFDLLTNCIEVKFEAIPGSAGCYNLIVYNHQWSQNGPPCPYNSENYLTFKFKDPDCWEDNNVNLELLSWSLNHSYSPAELKWEWNDNGTIRSKYDRNSNHPTQFTFNRKNNQDGSANPMARCQVDTFRLCIGCVDSLSLECVTNMDIEVFFSDANGNPTCINELGINGSDRASVSPRSPRCPGLLPESCDTGCTLYASNCNSFNITWGCDYADLEIINDHAYHNGVYPLCGPINEFEIGFAAQGLGLCKDDPVLDAGLPAFRDWKTVYDPVSGTLSFRAPPGCGLKTCDTFRVRIPFCCESQKTAGILFGKGHCGSYSYMIIDTVADPNAPGGFRYDTTFVNEPGSEVPGRGRIGWNKFDEEPGCAGCYFDKDKAAIKKALRCVADTNSDGICDIYWEDPSGCDTLILFNRNHSPEADCGDDTTGNQCWRFIELQLDREKGEPCEEPRVPTLDPNTPVTEVPPGSGKWRIGPFPKICKCEEVPIVICCYKGPIIWITEDINGRVISIDSTRVDWSTSCPEGSVPPQSKRVRFQTPDISQAAGHRLGNPVPNPTSGKVSVPVNIGELPAEHGEARISIYNEGGELLRVIRERVSSQSRRELDLDATGWSNGTYFVRLELNGAILTTRFVLRK